MTDNLQFAVAQTLAYQALPPRQINQTKLLAMKSGCAHRRALEGKATPDAGMALIRELLQIEPFDLFAF